MFEGKVAVRGTGVVKPPGPKGPEAESQPEQEQTPAPAEPLVREALYGGEALHQRLNEKEGKRDGG